MAENSEADVESPVAAPAEGDTPRTEHEAGRARLAELLGGLLASAWRRERAARPSAGDDGEVPPDE